MSIWHDDKVFPENKRYWLAFINVRCNGNKFWTVSHHLADFIEDVSGAGFRVCNTKIDKWCYLDDLLAQQAEINRLRKALNDCYEQASNWGACAELPVVIIDICHKVLNGESEEK